MATYAVTVEFTTDKDIAFYDLMAMCDSISLQILEPQNYAQEDIDIQTYIEDGVSIRKVDSRVLRRSNNGHVLIGDK